MAPWVPPSWLARAPSRAQVGALGALAFCTCALLPSIHRAATLPRHAFALLCLPPLLLAGGLLALPARLALATYLLLAAFPVSIALSTSRLDHDLALTTFSPAVLGFAMVSLCAYAACAVALCSTPRAMRKVEQRPLGEVSPIEPEARKQVLGALVLTTLLLGTSFVVLWSTWASPSRYREQWGRAAPEGATLTALTAGLAGTLLLALVGPALRASRSSASARDDRTRRIVWLFALALSGTLVYLLVALK